jgi:hypothetical protein
VTFSLDFSRASKCSEQCGTLRDSTVVLPLDGALLVYLLPSTRLSLNLSSR